MIPFVDRPPYENEVERLRLILSTYQDGSGMLQRPTYTLPGWRDFERAVSATFDGQAAESKWIYDVILNKVGENISYGISCKMRSTLRDAEKKGRAKIELSNASGEFWDALNQQNITQKNYQNQPAAVGEMLIQIVEGWHNAVGIDNGGMIDTSKSFFLALQWEEKQRRYQLFQYPVNLPEPQSLTWEVIRRRLIGRDSNGILFEWYGLSGGQLKYYPLTKDATWHSDIFNLEPLPEGLEFGLQNKAQQYFPAQWSTTLKD